VSGLAGRLALAALAGLVAGATAPGAAAAAGAASASAAAASANPHPAWLSIATDREPPGLAAALAKAALSDARERELREIGAGHVELLWRAEIRIAADGSLVERVTHVRRFLGEVGIAQEGDVVIVVQPSFESLAVEHAGVRLADGRTFRVEPHTVQVTAGEQPGIFSDRRAVTVPLPALTGEATGVVVYTRRYRGDAWPLAWSWHLPLRSGAPVERYEVDVSWDAAAPAPVWRTNDPRLDCAEQERRLRCVRTEAPPLEPDPDVRTGADSVPEFVLAEPQSWEEAARRVGALVEERQQLPPGTLEELLARGGTPRTDAPLTDTQKWETLYRFVADDVRYLGLEHGANAVVPRRPATTLARRFGDCKDKVTLFVALARAAGLPVVPVLVATRRFDPDAMLVPNVNYFDHMIACWDDPRLEACADLTVRGLSPSDSVEPLRDRVALPLREGTREPTTLAGNRFGWRVEVESATRLHCDGATETRVERHLRGGAQRFFRETYGGLTVAQRERFLADEHWRATSSPLVPEIEVHGIRDAGGPVSVSTALSTPAAQPLFDGYQHVDDDPWVRAYGMVSRSDNRHYDTWMPGLEVRSVHRYRVCDDFRGALVGPTLMLESAAGSLTRSYWNKRDEEELVVETVLELPGGILSPGEVRRLNGFLDNALDQLTIWFSLGER